MHIPNHHPGFLPGLKPTPESTFYRRREILKKLAWVTAGASLVGFGCNAQPNRSSPESGQERTESSTSDPSPATLQRIFPAPRNSKFRLERPITKEEITARYNNFYEFSSSKETVWSLVEKFRIEPWEIAVTGHVEKSFKTDIDGLVRKMPVEERLYRHRCVETWAMAVPWTGFPLRSLLEKAQPRSTATHVRFVSFDRPDEAPSQRDRNYPWPYQEGLTMAEAMNELAFLAVGIYGHVLPKQNGAPVRLVVPWKYGFKSIKSVLLIEVCDHRPATFWNTLIPHEYDFTANVNPNVPHPRWSQETEWLIDTGDRIPTRIYNGYGDWVAKLYQ